MLLARPLNPATMPGQVSHHQLRLAPCGTRATATAILDSSLPYGHRLCPIAFRCTSVRHDELISCTCVAVRQVDLLHITSSRLWTLRLGLHGHTCTTGGSTSGAVPLLRGATVLREELGLRVPLAIRRINAHLSHEVCNVFPLCWSKIPPQLCEPAGESAALTLGGYTATRLSRAGRSNHKQTRIDAQDSHARGAHAGRTHGHAPRRACARGPARAS
jgi:hypothetical protein